MIFIKMIFGFVLLIVGANLLVEGAVKIAQKFKVSTMIISMTIISIGTSMPEFVVACVSSLKGSQIALSNNVGSIITTIAISVGATSLLYTIHLKKSFSKEVIKMLAVQITLLFLLVLGDGLDIIDGFIFLTIFAFYMRYLIKNAKKIVSANNEKDLIISEEDLIEKTDDVIKNSIMSLTLFVVLGIIFTVYGGNYVVDTATQLAKFLNLSEAFIGVTVVALGTTLPELTTALVAARKKEYDIIVGNVVGSGVCNIMLIVGVASIIHPIYFTTTLLFQIGFMMLFGLFFYKLSKQSKIDRADGLALIITYVLFTFISLII